MLRRGISQRSPSVCAFCQHRLSWRRACSPHRRLLSSTKSLRDDDSSIPGLPGSTSTNGISTTNSFAVGSSGWGKPLFGGGRSSILPEKKTHADGGAPNNAVSQPHHGLLPHETEARNRLAAQEAVPERSGKAAQDRAAQPFDAPRKLWNSEMQQKILANIHREEKEARDAKPGRKTAGESLTGTPPIHIPSQQSPLMMKPLLPLSSTDKPSHDWRMPVSLQGNLQRQNRKRNGRVIPGARVEKGEQGMPSTGDWGMSTFAKMKPSGISEDNRAASRTAQWSSLSSTQFDDLPRMKRQTQSKFSNEPGPRSRREDRGTRETSAADDWEIKPASQVPTVVHEFVNRNQNDPDRDDRFEIHRVRAKDRKGGKPRGQRKARYDDPGEEGDGYEEWLDRPKHKKLRRAIREAERTEPRPITLPELISISHLASALKVDKSVFIDQLGELGFEGVSLDSIMAGETAALVAQEYGFEPTVESGGEQDLKARPPPADPSSLPPRPPVVTIMGHVDHGKTTLLDYLRKSSVAAQEHGGITQHIGAFSVKMSTGKQMTFLDTPGHAAFLTMRQRGANVTDIVVLVVAADDSVKPQTIEAIKHARAAKVPIIVAINKIDKEGARIDQVKSDLARNGVEIEDYGGDVQVACVSGKTGRGMEDLEENILTLSEILDMRAEDDGPAEGWILESSLKPIGKAATILVKRGTLRPGDYIAAGITFAKIRHMRNEAGIDIDEAPPGTPVEILGWRDLPAAGDEVIQAPDEKRARSAVGYREGLREREKDAADHEKISVQRKALQEQRQAEKATEGHTNKRQDGTWGTTEQTPDTEGGAKMVNFVVKGDVHGSVEAVCACILEIGSHEVRPRILRSVPGHITESDVEHAATSKSIIVNFNLPLSGIIKRQAEEAGVKILEHTVIYHLADDVKDTLSGYLSAEVSFKVNGEAEVLQVFPINVKGRKYKNIAGCRIRNGKVEKNDLLRVFRDGEQIFEGQMESLKHGKKDITDARKGGECGIGFEFFTDLKQGDLIQAVEEITTERTL
ncbi:translation initiation factor IF-2 [Xylariales sp. AK1849]|nr:translation initiation factor IF-2 [Xylariales sp. AK1849]